MWPLVRKPLDRTIIRTRWIYKNKLDENRVITSNKSKLVVQVFNQQEGIDYDETFSRIIRMEAIKILIALGAYTEVKLY